MASNHLILCRSLLLLPSVFPSIRVFPNKSVLCIRWPKYGSFSFIISPSNEYWGLISFRIDWLDLLAVQGTLKSLLQHYSSVESFPNYWPRKSWAKLKKKKKALQLLSLGEILLYSIIKQALTILLAFLNRGIFILWSCILLFLLYVDLMCWYTPSLVLNSVINFYSCRIFIWFCCHFSAKIHIVLILWEL